MLTEVFPDLYLGDIFACPRGIARPGHSMLTERHVTIHAAKDPCHRHAVGYERALPSSHPNYLTKRINNELFLNMIDPPAPLFDRELFWAAIEFIKEHAGKLPIIIHCNRGESRAPALALVYAAHAKLIPENRESYDVCAEWMKRKYPAFSPGKGIEIYLAAHWKELIDGRNIPPEAA